MTTQTTADLSAWDLLRPGLGASALALGLVMALVWPWPGRLAAQESPAPAPLTTIEPERAATPAAAESPTVSKRPAVRAAHRVARRPITATVAVEPARARLQLREDAWVYARPTTHSAHVARVHAPKYVVVTGSTRYFLRVRLRTGKVGYVETKAVEVLKPVDKIFTLTANASVRSEPNRWSKKVAEVHQGHEVHVVGLALNYFRIRMRSGLEGYIPATALGAAPSLQ